MTRTLSAVALGLIVSAAGASVRHVDAQQATPCLHGPNASDDDRTRRAAAIGVARSINTAEAQAWRAIGSYSGLTMLEGIRPLPVGFEVNLAADGAVYAFALKDTADPCGFMVFSDQAGVIYTGIPIQ